MIFWRRRAFCIYIICQAESCNGKKAQVIKIFLFSCLRKKFFSSEVLIVLLERAFFADMETAFKLAIPSCVAVTSVTAQNNTHYLKQSIVESALLRAQIQAVDQSIGAIKIGMLPDSASIEIVSDFLEKHLEIPSVLDPVFFSSTGANLFSLDSLVLLKSNLLSKITLLTPNAKEAAIITGFECSNLNQTTLNADEIVRLGARAVLIKGGHIDGAECIDTLVQKGENTILP